MSNNKKYRGINEIKIKLLPEKNKRDYILRLVSSIIVFVFIILNFFLLFLPSRNLTSEINKLSRELNKSHNVYENLYEQIYKIDKDLFNIKKNNEVIVIEEKNIDYQKIVSDFAKLLPVHSYIDNITYNEQTSTYKIHVQFDTREYLREFERDLQNPEKIKYITSVVTDQIQSIPVPAKNAAPRQATYFSIKIDLNKAPKVGDN